MRSSTGRLTAVALLALSACTPDRGGPWVTQPVPFADQWEDGAVALQATLASEKGRIAARAVAEAAVYDSLKGIWDEASEDDFEEFEGALICDPIQYAATVKVVGPAGGDLDFGPHKLSIPPGALEAPTVITAEAPTALRPLAVFSPHGTVFRAASPPRLDLSYKHCHAREGIVHRIGYLGESGTISEWPPSEDLPGWGIVRAWIAHFSAYIVAF